MSRIKSSFVAFGFNKSFLAVQQLSLVPIQLIVWGTECYGANLLLTALPAQLTCLCHLGFGTVGANRVARSWSGSDHKAARVSYSTTWTVLSLLGLLPIGVAMVCVFVVDLETRLNIPGFSNTTAWVTILLSILIWNIKQQITLANIAIRAVGKFPQTVHLSTMIAVMEFLAGGLIGVLLFGASPPIFLMILLLVNLLGVVVAVFMRRALAPTLSVQLKLTSRAEAMSLAKKSVQFAILPSTEALTNYSLLICIGLLGSPAAVAAFNTTRTAVNFCRQFVTAVTQSFEPEMAFAAGRGSIETVRNLHRSAVSFGLWGSVVYLTTLAVTAEYVFPVWTADKIALDYQLLLVLMLSQLLHGLWLGSARVLIVYEYLMKIGLAYAIMATIGMCVGIFTASKYGAMAYALAMTSTHAAMLILTVPIALNLSEDHLSQFFVHATSPIKVVRLLCARDKTPAVPAI